MGSLVEGATLKNAVRCTKCKSRRIVLIQLWSASTAFSFDKNGVCINSPYYGQDEWADNITMESVQARCSDCNHSWTLRKVVCADEVIEDKKGGMQG